MKHYLTVSIAISDCANGDQKTEHCMLQEKKKKKGGGGGAAYPAGKYHHCKVPSASIINYFYIVLILTSVKYTLL